MKLILIFSLLFSYSAMAGSFLNCQAKKMESMTKTTKIVGEVSLDLDYSSGFNQDPISEDTSFRALISQGDVAIGFYSARGMKVITLSKSLLKKMDDKETLTLTHFEDFSDLDGFLFATCSKSAE